MYFIDAANIEKIPWLAYSCFMLNVENLVNKTAIVKFAYILKVYI